MSKQTIATLVAKAPIEELTVTITELQEPRSINATTKVQNGTVSDKSGTASLSLWNDQVGTFKKNDTVKVTKGWCTEFQGAKQVSTGKFGKIERQ